MRDHSSDRESLQALERASREREPENTTVIPHPFDPDDASPQIVDRVRHLTEKKSQIQSMEYLLHRNLLIVDFYQAAVSGEGKPALNNILEIIDAEKGKVLHRDTIASGTAVPTPDTFFVKDDFLYFVKNHATLTALRLWKS